MKTPLRIVQDVLGNSSRPGELSLLQFAVHCVEADRAQRPEPEKPKLTTRGEEVAHEWGIRYHNSDGAIEELDIIAEAIDAEILRERAACRKAVEEVDALKMKDGFLAAIDARGEPEADRTKEHKTAMDGISKMREKFDASVGLGATDRCAEIAENMVYQYDKNSISIAGKGRFQGYVIAPDFNRDDAIPHIRATIADALRLIASECAEIVRKNRRKLVVPSNVNMTFSEAGEASSYMAFTIDEIRRRFGIKD